MSKLYHYLKRGPILVGEVRGFKSEVFEKFDKSDKSAPPITVGVFKINIELLEDGSPVMVSIYPPQGERADQYAEKFGLKRGVVVALVVSKSEAKGGQRIVTSPITGVWVLDSDEEQKLRSA